MTSGILTDTGIFIGGGGEGYAVPQELTMKLANRHGLIAGATGTGKTITLQIMAEAFSLAGVPVFMADVKGDLSGMAHPGSAEHKLHEAFTKRAATIGYDLGYRGFPVTYWDLFGEQGHPVRTTISDMGPLLLARLLSASPAQEGMLNVAFRLADEEGLALLDLKDLRALLTYLNDNQRDISARYGLVEWKSLAAMQRELLVLENQGATEFFAEPAIELADLMRLSPEGLGQINVLAADKLMQSPRLYSTFLLWLLSELFEELPEVGDPDKPKLVFFFDEAHLLFSEAPKALVEKVVQVARLIRSKGVGVYFITQNPYDVPDSVLSQLGNRVQHALRAYTPRDVQGLEAAASTYRPNPAFSTAEAIKSVGIGEAVTSFLNLKGEPGIVERTLVRPPASRVGVATPEERAATIAASPLRDKYTHPVDRDSAYELLAARAAAAAVPEEAALNPEFNKGRRYEPNLNPDLFGTARKKPAASSRSDSIIETFGKSLARQVGSRAGQAIVRGVLGSIFKSR